MTINITWHFYCLVTNSQLAHVVHYKWPRQAVCTPATGRELTHTLNLTFLYVTVSTLNPTVGMVVTDWPSFNLYRMAEMESRALILETHTHTDTRTHWHMHTLTQTHSNPLSTPTLIPLLLSPQQVDTGLPCGIQPQHEDAHVLLPKEFSELGSHPSASPWRWQGREGERKGSNTSTTRNHI